MRVTLGALMVFGAVALSAGDKVDHRKVPGLVLEIRSTDSGIETSPVVPGTLHWHSLVAFGIQPVEGSSMSYRLEGTVVSNNTGFPSDGVPIYFGSDHHRPRRAGLTNKLGRFRFVLYLGEDSGQDRLKASALEQGKIYLDGRSDSDGMLTSGLTRAYDLEEIMAHQGSKPAAPAPTDE